MARLVTEFIGTFFLVLTIGLSGDPLAIGLTLAVMVYMGGHISGGHYNPAVSLGVFLRGKLSAKEMLFYWVTQILAAIVAALVIFYITGFAFAPAPGTDVSMLKAIVVEFIFTFALVLVVLNVATTQKNQPNSYFGLAIGLTIFVGASAGGAVSGGAYNPSVALGPIIVKLISSEYDAVNILIYLIGPFLGAVVASYIFRITNPDEFKDISLTYHEK
jgi:aquaporin Z